MTDLATEIEETDESDELLDSIFETVQNIAHPDLDGFTLDFEDPPIEPAREPRRQKVILAWEEYLNFLTSTPGRWVKVFEFTGENAKERSRARARSMTSRLVKTKPTEIWTIKAAQDRDVDGALVDVWKVYAQFNRAATSDEIADREQKHADAVARGQHAADVRQKALASASASAPAAK